MSVEFCDLQFFVQLFSECQFTPEVKCLVLGVGGVSLILKTDQILASLIYSVQLEESSSKIDPAPF